MQADEMRKVSFLTWEVYIYKGTQNKFSHFYKVKLQLKFKKQE